MAKELNQRLSFTRKSLKHGSFSVFNKGSHLTAALLFIISYMQRLNINTQQYFDLPHASNSKIKEAHKVFQTHQTFTIDTTKAFREGSAFDALTTEIDQFNSNQVDVNKLLKMQKALKENIYYKTLFNDADKQAVFIEDNLPIEYEGLSYTIPAKCKYDLFKEIIGGDIKTTVATSQEAFEKAALFLGYHVQGAWYMDIAQVDRFVIIGISKQNFRSFSIGIKRNDHLYNLGKELYQKYAVSWWKLSGQ